MANYLYNGIELPALPEWDREKYPYAIIGDGFVGTIFTLIALQDAEFYVAQQGDNTNKLVYTSNAPYLYWAGSTVNGEWSGGEEIEQDVLLITPPYWSNTNVYWQDGTLYLAASDPVPVNPPQPIDSNSLLAGYLVGCRLRAMRGKRTPIAYLYNGVKLPPLPEWDREAYPHAYIYEHLADGSHWLCVSKTPFRLYEVPEEYTEWVESNGEAIRYVVMMPRTDPHWEYFIDEPDGIRLDPYYWPPIWSNHDILNEDGTVYLAATEPVPVYE